MNDETRGTIKFVIGVVCILVVMAVMMEVTGNMHTSKNKQTTTTSTTTEDIQQQEEEKLILPIGVEGIDNAETGYLVGDIKIPRVLEPDENGVIKIIEPVALLEENVENSDERAKLRVEALLLTGVAVVDAYGNKDGSVTLFFDIDNWELNLQKHEYFFEDLFYGLNNKVSISKDYQHLIIYVDENTDPIEFGYDSVAVTNYIVFSQIYTGVSYREWNFVMSIVYEKTGEIMLEHTFDGEGTFSITDEDWNAMFENLEQ